jgi:hypothetical protein
MHATAYQRLIEDLCTRTGLDDPGRLLRDGLLRIDGVDMRIFRSEAEDDDTLHVQVDLGPLPAGSEALMCIRLLAVNHLTAAAGACYSITLSPAHAVLGVRQPLDDAMDGARLAAALRDIAEHALRHWGEMMRVHEADAARIMPRSAANGLACR